MRPEDVLTVEALEAGDIPEGSFTHEGHVYVAWLYLDRHPLPVAIDRFTAALKALTRKLGVPGKYHETITWFFMLAIAERRAAAPGADWPDFRSANADLLDWQNNPLRRYYSKALLDSDEARLSFRLPDRIAA